MIITSLENIYDCFGFYPDRLHYSIESENIEDTIYNKDEMQDFIDLEGQRNLKNVLIMRDGSEIVLYVSIE